MRCCHLLRHSLHPFCRLQQLDLLLTACEHPLTSQHLFSGLAIVAALAGKRPLLGGLLVHWIGQPNFGSARSSLSWMAASIVLAAIVQGMQPLNLGLQRAVLQCCQSQKLVRRQGLH